MTPEAAPKTPNEPPKDFDGLSMPPLEHPKARKEKAPVSVEVWDLAAPEKEK